MTFTSEMFLFCFFFAIYYAPRVYRRKRQTTEESKPPANFSFFIPIRRLSTCGIFRDAKATDNKRKTLVALPRLESSCMNARVVHSVHVGECVFFSRHA